jgi:hypothetical protein
MGKTARAGLAHVNDPGKLRVAAFSDRSPKLLHHLAGRLVALLKIMCVQDDLCVRQSARNGGCGRQMLLDNDDVRRIAVGGSGYVVRARECGRTG